MGRNSLLLVGAVVLVTVATARLGVLAQATKPADDRPRSVEQEIEALRGTLGDLTSALSAERAKVATLVEATRKLGVRADAIERRAMRAESAATSLGERADREARLQVPLGTMLPYFGDPDKLPDGFVLADGVEKWPPASWVPTNLHGKQVPKMAGMLIAGAATTSDLLEASTPGSLAVDGSNFKVGSVDVARATDQIPVGFGGYQVIYRVQTFDFDKDLIFQIRQSGQINQGSRFAAIPQSNYKDNQPTTISGTATIPVATLQNAPPHVRCYWIIRTR